MKNVKEEQMQQPLPYTQEELNEYIEGTISWVHVHPAVLMRIVAIWVTQKFVSSQLSNDMSKEKQTSDKQQNGNDFIADVIISLPMREKIEFIHNAVKKATEKRKEQGFQMTHKKRQMYEMGFEDAIEWVLGNEL